MDGRETCLHTDFTHNVKLIVLDEINVRDEKYTHIYYLIDSYRLSLYLVNNVYNRNNSWLILDGHHEPIISIPFILFS